MVLGHARNSYAVSDSKMYKIKAIEKFRLSHTKCGHAACSPWTLFEFRMNINSNVFTLPEIFCDTHNPIVFIGKIEELIIFIIK